MRHFKPEEFKCKCGKCGKGAHAIEPMILEMLDDAREVAGIPFHISSALRCATHNEAIGGTSNSSHLNGTAFDIVCLASRDRFTIIEALLNAGFNRIGIAKDFIHVDYDREKAPNVIWTY